MFDKQSRYYGLETYEVIDSRNRKVPVVPTPSKSDEKELGTHMRIQGQRIDHLAHRYLANANGFWRIADLNDVMLPETLSEALEIKIPRKQRGR